MLIQRRCIADSREWSRRASSSLIWPWYSSVPRAAYKTFTSSSSVRSVWAASAWVVVTSPAGASGVRFSAGFSYLSQDSTLSDFSLHSSQWRQE